jgi:hypothetical protein
MFFPSFLSFLSSSHTPLTYGTEKYWQIVANRRKFFFDIAEAKKFDPLIAKNWYSVTEKTLMEFKVQNAVEKMRIRNKELYSREQGRRRGVIERERRTEERRKDVALIKML